MPYFNYDDDIDIDVHFFFSKMNDRECGEMFKLLIKHDVGVFNDLRGSSGDEFKKSIIKLINNYFQLSLEEIETINKITKRF